MGQTGRSVRWNGSKGYDDSIVEISRPFVDETLLVSVRIVLMKTMDDEWKNQTWGNVGLRWSA